jgi:FixJ family two-component response regulator
MLDRDEHRSRVFVVDDDGPLRESLVALFERHGLAVRAFSTPTSFLRYYSGEMAGCLVLDICMPTQNGLELYEQLLREGKRLPVIFLTGHADIATAVAAMRLGAIEFIEKPFDHDVLLDRVGKALVVDSQWRARHAAIAALEERIARLNGREIETLRLIEAGESNKSMAAKLLLTERAVEMRRSAIMRKLEVASVAELLELTITHRIFTDVGTSEGLSAFGCQLSARSRKVQSRRRDQ